MKAFFSSFFFFAFTTPRSSSGAGLPLSTVSIRGHPQVQQLPSTYVGNFPVFTCDLQAIREEDMLVREEGGDTPGGWINPTSLSQIFLPSDLPLPVARPSLGICLTNGVPRYLMPSIVLTVQTPNKQWRNRGLNSLPRARAWIDMFASFTAPVDKLYLSSFGQYTNELRFLEDQDGSSAWSSLAKEEKQRTILRPEDPSRYAIAPTYDLFVNKVLKGFSGGFDELKQDYVFVDIPLINMPPINLPPCRRIRQFLSDFEEPRRLLELEDPTALDGEPCGELEVSLIQVSPGSESEFLPDVYKELYEEGNVIMW